MLVVDTGNGMPVRAAQFDATADPQPSAVVVSKVEMKLDPRFRIIARFLQEVATEAALPRKLSLFAW
jgi:hypothetical protein